MRTDSTVAPGSARLIWSVLVGIMLAAGPAFADDARSPVDKLTKRDRLFDVAMVSNHVWVVGFPGIILHSADAGLTWEAQAGGEKDALFAIDFVDENTGWLVGRNGLVMRTVDGGKKWKRLDSGLKEHLFDVDFVDAQNGWAVGNFGMVAHTTDSGQTWSRVAIKLAEEDDGFGDDDWLDEGAEEEEAEEEEVFDRLLNSVTFQDSKTGWIAGESGLVLHTSDGGQSWTEQDSGEWAPMYSVAFADGRLGLVVGSEATLLLTADSGENWEKVETDQKDHLLRVIIVGERFFASGRRGLLITGDMAQTSDEIKLRRIPTGVYTWLDAIAMTPDGIGLLVGGQGLIMRTTDHGATWNRLGK